MVDSFANPMWLWVLLLLVPLVGFRVWSQVLSQRSLKGLVAPRLQSVLVSRTSQLRHWLVFLFLLAGLACLVVALARPRWGYEEVESFSKGRSILLAIDTSRSMLAKDLAPNRIERAKLAARDIVAEMGGSRMGLLAFAGKAFLQAPLTIDHLAVNELLDQVDTDLVPRGGTNLSEALAVALEAFSESESKQQALIIFSDGEALEGHEQVSELKEKADKQGMMILTVGVGTEKGELIPELGADGRVREGAYVRDSNGQVVRSRLDSVALKALATGGGRYIQLGDRASLTKVVKSITSNLDTVNREEKIRKRPIERFMFPLAVGVFFLIVAHLIHLLFGYLESGRAVKLPSLIPFSKRQDSKVKVLVVLGSLFGLLEAKDQPWGLVESEDYASAVVAFEAVLNGSKLGKKERTSLYMGLGSTLFRLGKYVKATDAYGKALQYPSRKFREPAHYNLGNTLFRQGEVILTGEQKSGKQTNAAAIEKTLRHWGGAVEHYEAALSINPESDDAIHNLAFVKKRIKTLESMPPPEEDNDDSDLSSEQQEPQPDPDDKQQEGDPPKEGQNQGDDQSGDGQPNEGEGSSDPSQPSSQTEDDSQDSSQDEPNNETYKDSQDQQEGEEESLSGNLSANDEHAPPTQGKQNLDQRLDRNTGYTPAEARQLIETLADEHGHLRPALPRPKHDERYRNW